MLCHVAHNRTPPSQARKADARGVAQRPVAQCPRYGDSLTDRTSLSTLAGGLVSGDFSMTR
jgi:hypothetical protein